MQNQSQRKFEVGGGETIETFDPVFELKKVAENARERVEQEFSRTNNTWLECFLTDVSEIRLILELKKMPPKLQRSAEGKYGVLAKKASELQEMYPTRETVPPKEVQDELFSALDVLEESRRS